MSANTPQELEALAKAAAGRATGAAATVEFSPAEQRHLQDHIERARARAAAAKAGVNTAAPDVAATASPSAGPAAKPDVPPPAASTSQTASAPAPAQAAAPKEPGKVHKAFEKIEESAETARGQSATRGARKWLGRIALPLAAIDIANDYKQIDGQFEAGEVKSATTNSFRLAGKYGGAMAMTALGAKLGAGIGTFAIPVPIVGTIAGSLGGIVIGGGLGIAGYLLGDKAGGIAGKFFAPAKDQSEIDADSKRHELATQKYLEAAKAEALGGNTPALRQATLTARQEYIAARKEAITETDEQRTANVKAIDAQFATLAKRHVDHVKTTAAAYDKSKTDYKSLITASVMATDTVTPEQMKAQQDAINAAGIAMFKARRATLEGRSESMEASKAVVVKWGEDSVAEAEKARAASAPRTNAPAAASAGVPAPTAGSGTPGARKPVTPVPQELLNPPAPAAPPKEKGWLDGLKDIPVIGPILGALGGFFGAGETDPSKKSQFGKLIDTATGWIGDTKKGLSGMGMLAAGLAVFAAVNGAVDGFMGVVLGVIAAAIVVPMISGLMKSFGSSPSPEGARAPAVGGPEQNRSQSVSQQQQVVVDTASLQQATQRANLQPSTNLTGGATVAEAAPTAAPPTVTVALDTGTARGAMADRA